MLSPKKSLDKDLVAAPIAIAGIQKAIVGRETECLDLSVQLQAPFERERSGMPKLNNVVLAAGGQPFAVWAVSNRTGHLLKVIKFGNELALRNLPTSNGPPHGLPHHE